MDTSWSAPTRRLSDSELIARVRHLAGRERQATACLVAHLAELDERRLYLAEGCSSLFTYCTEVLHLSEHAAYLRITAARAARKFPKVLEELSDGSVHLTSIKLLAQHLTAENHQDLLDEVKHRSKIEVEELIARMQPLPPVASMIRRVPLRRHATDCGSVAGSAEATLQFEGGVESTGADPACVPASATDLVPAIHPQADPAKVASRGITGGGAGNQHPATRTPQPASVNALAPELYKVQFTADAETYKTLCQARELLRHQIPDGDAAAVIGLALKVLVEKLSQQKLGTRTRRRPGWKRIGTAVAASVSNGLSASSKELDNAGTGRHHRAASHASHRCRSRHIPADVRSEVWRRDQGRCAFVARNGRRCTERGRLEYHHVKPFALGGATNVDNIELRCRAHNAHEAELFFGSELRGCAGRELGRDRVRFTVAETATRSGPSPIYCGGDSNSVWTESTYCGGDVTTRSGPSRLTAAVSSGPGGAGCRGVPSGT